MQTTVPGMIQRRHFRTILGSQIGHRTDTLFNALFPSALVWHNISVMKVVAAIICIIITASLAQVRFFLPDNPVPITLQTFAVLITGGFLGMKWGFVTAIGYYLVGMAGLPVFQSGQSGWEYVTQGVTGGYLLGFILTTTVVGYLSERGFVRGQALWAMVIGALILYLPALIWLSVFDFGWPAEGELLSKALYPFIPGDLIKLIFAGLSIGLLWRLIDIRKNSKG